MTGIQYLNVIGGYEFFKDNLAMTVNTTFFILALFIDRPTYRMCVLVLLFL